LYNLWRLIAITWFFILGVEVGRNLLASILISTHVLILIKQKPCQIHQINISDIIIDSYSFCAILSSSNVMNNIHQFCEIHFIILKFFLLLNITNFRNIRWNKSYFCNCRNTAFPGQIILLDKEPNPVSSYFDQ